VTSVASLQDVGRVGGRQRQPMFIPSAPITSAATLMIDAAVEAQRKRRLRRHATAWVIDDRA